MRRRVKIIQAIAGAVIIEQTLPFKIILTGTSRHILPDIEKKHSKHIHLTP
ncbi:MAG: hypothetical protein GXO26_04540 [Crenarchaeota archaeon]|nr:hypothetical protein [Thermoproteota archaeon]